MNIDVVPIMQGLKHTFKKTPHWEEMKIVIELLRELHNLRMKYDCAQWEINKLKDFAIWMTGCGYDFTQHDYFNKCRDELLIGKNDLLSQD